MVYLNTENVDGKSIVHIKINDDYLTIVDYDIEFQWEDQIVIVTGNVSIYNGNDCDMPNYIIRSNNYVIHGQQINP